MEQDFNKYFLPNQPYSSKVYNTNQSHPLIPSSQEYLFYKKYVSIHSEDRDIIKYPNASFFEIELIHGGKYHVSSKEISIFLHYMGSIWIHELFCKTKIYKSYLM